MFAQKKLIIGKLDLGCGVLVAPMVGITDLPFRKMCRKFGADMCFTEMAAAPAMAAELRGAAHNVLNRILARDPDEHPYAVQVFGGEPQTVAVAAKAIAERGADLIDFNMGCPSRRIVTNGGGSALLKYPTLAARCIEALRKAAPDIPITVKFRAGYDAKRENVVEIAKIAEGEGASAITVHGRLRTQGYGEKSDPRRIAEAVKAVSIPVIGNGDIFKAEDAVRMKEVTGCAGVMPARGVLGNPWLIAEVSAALMGREIPQPPQPKDKLKTFLSFWRDLAEFRTPERALLDIRKHLIWFTKGLRGAQALRKKLWSFESEQTLVDEVTEFFTQAQEYHDAGQSSGSRPVI